MNRSDVDALFFARGGYGSVRIMESLDFSGLKKHPKWIIGFSDACYLLNPIAEVLPTLHGPMAIQLETDAMTDTLLAQFLTGKHYTWNCTVEQAASFHCDDAVLIGGNLSIVYAMLATPFWKVPSGAILFLEDLDEYLYHIDRMMASLYFSGTLTKVQAVLAGSFSDMKDHTTPIGWTASECLQHWCNKANTPLIEGLPFGHKKENYPLILGQPCSISVKNEQFSIRWA